MLGSAIGALSDRLDSKFLTAFWLPAFVAVLGGFGILAGLVGADQLVAWIDELDSVQETIAVILIMLAITMVASVLRALSRPIISLFAGEAMPRVVAEWSIRNQRKARQILSRSLLPGKGQHEVSGSSRPYPAVLRQRFPQDESLVQPTAFGNVLETAREHAWIAYAMDGNLWWPRLTPLLPQEFRAMLGGAQAPLMALLNLSVVFCVLAVVAVAAFGFRGGEWVTALIAALAMLVLARCCYHAAVGLATEVASILRVAFDLYRHEILSQLGLETPGDLAAERTLWQELDDRLLDLPSRPTGGLDPTAGAA